MLWDEPDSLNLSQINEILQVEFVWRVVVSLLLAIGSNPVTLASVVGN